MVPLHKDTMLHSLLDTKHRVVNEETGAEVNKFDWQSGGDSGNSSGGLA